MSQFALSIMSGIVIATITAWVTVRLSLRQFYKEKWWERRAKAYQNIIEALYDMKRFTDECLAGYREWEYSQMDGQEVEVSEESARRHQELLRKHKDAAENIDRVTAIGAFVISAKAIKYLTELQAELEDAKRIPDDDVQMENEAAALGRCIERVRECAKKELNVSKV